jgi:hypothetical protein
LTEDEALVSVATIGAVFTKLRIGDSLACDKIGLNEGTIFSSNEKKN